MKQVPGMLLLAAVLGGLFVLAGRQKPASDPEDLLDLFVDTGVEFSASPVETNLLEHRKIVIGTDINPNTVQRVARALLLLDAQDSNRPIDLYIRTEGGRLDDAFGIVSVMQSLKTPVNTHAIGGTHSAGAMILAAGTGVRYGYPFSSIMFHAGLYQDDGDHGENTLDNRRLVTFWEQNARLPAAWLHSKTEKTYFVGPEKALELGLVDQIRTKLPKLQGQGAKESLSSSPGESSWDRKSDGRRAGEWADVHERLTGPPRRDGSSILSTWPTPLWRTRPSQIWSRTSKPAAPAKGFSRMCVGHPTIWPASRSLAPASVP